VDFPLGFFMWLGWGLKRAAVETAASLPRREVGKNRWLPVERNGKPFG